MKLLRGEYTDAKATSKTIPSFWGFVNIVYGVSTTGKLSLSSDFVFASSEDAAICKPDSRVSFSDMSELFGVGRVRVIGLCPFLQSVLYPGSNAKPCTPLLQFTKIPLPPRLSLLILCPSATRSKSKLATLTVFTNASRVTPHCHLP